MDKEQAKNLISKTFGDSFDKYIFTQFLKNLLKTFEEKSIKLPLERIPEGYRSSIDFIEVIGTYKDDKNNIIDLLIISLRKDSALERARTLQRNLVAWYLKNSIPSKDAALVAFITPNSEDWRFSLVKIDYLFSESSTGNLKIKEQISPSKRWSFLVGKNEKTHTPQKRFIEILVNDYQKPNLENLEEAFNVEVVTEEFFEAYKEGINKIKTALSNYNISESKKHSFAQLLLSRIMFLYFLQRKGWFKWKNYDVDKNYIKNLWEYYKNWKKKKNINNKFYTQWLSSLFFGAFNKKSHLISNDLPEEIIESYKLMPFLNGGLFSKTELDELNIDLPDSIFEWLFEPDFTDPKKGFLEIYNFTIDESMPLDIEVAVDPEMLGRVYESLIAEEERGSSGIFYTPRVEIDFMCRLALIEYLSNTTKISIEKIIDFIYDPHNKIQELTKDECKTIKEKLDELKIVDPAVGSGSFLVSMMNILVTLHTELTRYIEDKEENLFALKEKIILENLYGVDVKDWATMVAELRLWLSLIIETDEKYMDIYTKPLLPNLSFKIRQGDSLIREIGGIYINLKEELRTGFSEITESIKELIDRKKEFFIGKRRADLSEIKEIEQFEQDIFRKILLFKIKKLNQEIQELYKAVNILRSQGSLLSGIRKNEKEIKEKEEEIKKRRIIINNLNKLIENLNKKSQKDYFLWEVDFIEVFAEKGGFDIVIGNPPYVRQENIAPPIIDKKNYSEDEWREIKKEYKERLIESVQNIWNNNIKIDKKSDLYVYFYYQGLSLLRDNGLFCFINSNSWLDVGYGTYLQEFLIKNMKPLYIFDNLKKRSFKQADINTIIVLIQKPDKKIDDYIVKFIAFKKPFDEINNSEIIKKIYYTDKTIFNDENFRIFPKTKNELLLEGIEIPDEKQIIEINPELFPYIGNKWGGKYLRAPEIYFKILEKGKGKLIRLGDIAEVKSGIITGNNTKYYKKKTENYDLNQYSPVFKTPREVNKIFLKEKDTISVIKIFNVPYDIRRAPLLWVDIRGEKHICHYNADNLPFEHNFYGILGKKIENETLCLLLNSTLTWLIVEVIGRKGLGGGAVRLVKTDLLRIPCLNNVSLSFNEYQDFINRPIFSIFTELGFDPNKPIREQEPNPLPDRKALDDIVFDALGLTEEEKREVYWAVAELVKIRLEKAKSV